MAKKRLLDREKRFVEAFVKTSDAEYAATKAGYPGPKRGYDLLHVPMIMNAIEARRAARESLDTAAPAVVKEHVARLLGRSGEQPSHGEFAKLVSPFYKLLADRGFGGSLTERDASEMTGDELRAALDVMRAEADRLESVIADRAVPIEAAPELAPEEDLFG